MEPQGNIVDILYVEDDAVDIESVKRVFKKVNESCTIEIASNSEIALNKLYGQKGEIKIHPRVLLLDINLPKVNGIELLKIIHKNPSLAMIEVFILTSAFTTEDKFSIRDLNVRGQIIKPLEYADALNIYWAIQHT